MLEELNVTFIIPKNCLDENECSEDMQLAFVTSEQHRSSGLCNNWLHESLMTSFEGITKKDVFVLTEFEGELYEKLSNTDCLLLGPRCLNCCLTENNPIPWVSMQVYTVAMRDLVVTASGFNREIKEMIKKKVSWMGGYYQNVMTDNTTHLISDNVLSDKYAIAVERGLPAMSVTWVDAVWEASLRRNVNGSSAEFKTHRLPVFMNLEVTTTGIFKKEKQIIAKLVNENGGRFNGIFESETNDVLVLKKEGICSDKYKAAKEFDKICVLPTWITDSVAKGVALPVAMYKITGASTSSPLIERPLPDMSLNFSRIPNSRPHSNFVDETRSTDISTMSTGTKFSQERKSNECIDKDVLMAFEKFDTSLIKKAGPIFDGFCIWVCGVEGLTRERIAACVSRCGGVRYDVPTPRVTHILAGSMSAAMSAAQALPNAPVLSPLWIVKSVEAGRPLDEAEVRSKTPVKSARKQQTDAASPMSKRNLQLLRRPPLHLPPPSPIVEYNDAQQDELVNHYLSQNASQNLRTPINERSIEPGPENTLREEHPDVTEDLEDDVTEEMEQIFRGLKIEVQGLSEKDITEIGAEIAAVGGTLVMEGVGGTHVLVPLYFDIEDLSNKNAEPVTMLWIKDCMSQQELVDIQYYHRPVSVARGANIALCGVVISLSTYCGHERIFLEELSKLLGATTQQRFCRRNTENAMASTHLICPSATGDKYTGALKWGLPAVTGAWLLECARQGRRVSEKGYLVGDTKALSSLENSMEQDEDHTNITTDKQTSMLPPAEVKVDRRDSVHKAETTHRLKLTNEEQMSPASRYIAMARQGLLGDAQETPKRLQQLKKDDKLGGEAFGTPPIEDALSSPNLAGLSPSTRRKLQALRRGEMPLEPIRTPVDPFDRKESTPDSGFGGALRPGSGRMSPDARKRLWKFVSGLPSKQPEPIKDNNTPLSEIRNRYLSQFNRGSSKGFSEHNVVAPRKLQLQDAASDTPPAKIAKMSDNHFIGGSSNVTRIEDKDKSSSSAADEAASSVDIQLQRLDEALTGRTSLQRRRPTREFSAPPPTTTTVQQDLGSGPESQVNTVGWDDGTPVQHITEPTSTHIVKRFMLSSNVGHRKEIIATIKQLGGEVSENNELDLQATHLLCSSPGRYEKMLGSISAGKWILHPAYIAKCRQANAFLPEEEFEWGNPLAKYLPGVTGQSLQLASAAHKWRVCRESGAPGPFAGVVALLHVPSPRKELLKKFIIVGGGEAPDDESPYSNEDITVCFADIKRYPLSTRDLEWFKSKGIPVCSTVLISSYLTDDEPPIPKRYCILNTLTT